MPGSCELLGERDTGLRSCSPETVRGDGEVVLLASHDDVLDVCRVSLRNVVAEERTCPDAVSDGVVSGLVGEAGDVELVHD